MFLDQLQQPIHVVLFHYDHLKAGGESRVDTGVDTVVVKDGEADDGTHTRFVLKRFPYKDINVNIQERPSTKGYKRLILA